LGNYSNKNTPNKRILITIPEDLKEQLTNLAKKDDRTFTSLVLRILKRFVEENTRE